MIRRFCFVLFLAILPRLSPVPSLQAGELALKIQDKQPPPELAPGIREKLQAKAIQLLDGANPALEFWLVSELPLQSKPESTAKALDSVKQATLLGAVSVSKARHDYRDDDLAAGVYTMRFGLQPQDGNHLGTAEFPYFAVLIQAKLDTSPAGITDYKKMVKTSSKDRSSEHPMILSLRPASSEAGEAPKLKSPAPDHKSVRVKIPASASSEKTAIVFEIVYDGMGKK